MRFKTLGKQYTPEALQRRILYPKPPRRAGKEQPPANRFLLLLGETQPRRLSGLRALYFSYLYKMGALPKKPRYPSYAVREDIRKLDKRIEQAEFIFKNHIEDRGQLAAIRQKAEDEIAVLIKQRQKLYRYETGLSADRRPHRAVGKSFAIPPSCAGTSEIHSIEMEKRLQAAQMEEQRRREHGKRDSKGSPKSRKTKEMIV